MPTSGNAEGIQEKSPHLNSSVEKSPQEKTPQISPVEKTSQPVLQPMEKSSHPFWGHVEKNPQFPTTVFKIYKCFKLY